MKNKHRRLVFVVVVLAGLFLAIHATYWTWDKRGTPIRPEGGLDVVCTGISKAIFNKIQDEEYAEETDSIFQLKESSGYWEVAALYDRWARPFMVAIDRDGNGVLQLKPGLTIKISQGGVFVWSGGKDEDYWTFNDNGVSRAYTITP